MPDASDHRPRAFDFGWLFLIPGLAMLFAGVVIPAQEDLRAVSARLERMEARERTADARVDAYVDFLDDMQRRDRALVRRLAAGQLNLIPAGETPAYVSSSILLSVDDWINATVPPETVQSPRIEPSMLTRWSIGAHRLWLLGGACLCVFIGLISDRGLSRFSRRVGTPDSEPPGDTRQPSRMAEIDAPEIVESTCDRGAGFVSSAPAAACAVTAGILLHESVVDDEVGAEDEIEVMTVLDQMTLDAPEFADSRGTAAESLVEIDENLEDEDLELDEFDDDLVDVADEDDEDDDLDDDEDDEEDEEDDDLDDDDDLAVEEDEEIDVDDEDEDYEYDDDDDEDGDDDEDDDDDDLDDDDDEEYEDDEEDDDDDDEDDEDEDAEDDDEDEEEEYDYDYDDD